MVVEIGDGKALILSEKIASHIPLHTHANNVSPIADYVLEDRLDYVYSQKEEGCVNKIAYLP